MRAESLGGDHGLHGDLDLHARDGDSATERARPHRERELLEPHRPRLPALAPAVQIVVGVAVLHDPLLDAGQVVRVDPPAELDAVVRLLVGLMDCRQRRCRVVEEAEAERFRPRVLVSVLLGRRPCWRVGVRPDARGVRVHLCPRWRVPETHPKSGAAWNSDANGVVGGDHRGLLAAVGIVRVDALWPRHVFRRRRDVDLGFAEDGVARHDPNATEQDAVLDAQHPQHVFTRRQREGVVVDAPQPHVAVRLECPHVSSGGRGAVEHDPDLVALLVWGNQLKRERHLRFRGRSDHER